MSTETSRQSAGGERVILHDEGVIHVPEEAAGGTARKVWALTRISLGFVFLWAFLDKAFALGFATGRQEDGTIDFFADGAAWFNGGSPTFGFLEFGTKGPFAGFFQSFAGAGWANVLFMVGLLGIGVALLLGIGMRIAAVSGAVMMVLMWAAALWPANNPVIDDHIVYALVLIGLALTNAGDTYGLGRRWSRTDLVQRYPVLR